VEFMVSCGGFVLIISCTSNVSPKLRRFPMFCVGLMTGGFAPGRGVGRGEEQSCFSNRVLLLEVVYILRY
jgi:hypothetical protein